MVTFADAGNTTTLFDELLIVAERFENIRLSEGELHLLMFIIESDDDVFDLIAPSVGESASLQ